jgi:hypothetical protein
VFSDDVVIASVSEAISFSGRAGILPANVGEPLVGSRGEAVPAGGYKTLPYIFADPPQAGLRALRGETDVFSRKDAKPQSSRCPPWRAFVLFVVKQETGLDKCAVKAYNIPCW